MINHSDIQPSNIELRVLKHVARYGLTTHQGVACSMFDTGGIDPIVGELLAGLTSRELLTRFAITSDYWAYVIADKGRERIGAQDDKFDCRHSFRSLITCVAMLHFCCIMNENCMRITKSEIAELFPGLARRGATNTHYIRCAQPNRLFGIARVDFGGSGSWERSVEKAVEKARQLIAIPAYRQLAKSQRLEFAVLTALPDKAHRIQESFKEYRNTIPVRMLAVAIPELLPLVAPLSS